MSLVQEIVEQDEKLFLVLNGYHSDLMDQPFYYISSDWAWIPLYVFFIYLIIKQFKKKSWLPICAIVLAVTCSDQGSSFIKRKVKRLRPSHTVYLNQKVHTVNNYRGGQYGFVSSHAANTFCVAFLISLLLKTSAIESAFLFSWALLVAYSRIYLGVHFPLDIVMGAIIGLVIGFIVYSVEKKVEKRLFYQATLP